MYEHRLQALAPRGIFLRRVATSTGLGLSLVVLSLAVGMLGFHFLEGLTWIDSYLNAAMLLGGMGPLEHGRSSLGKLFEGTYAIYCGLAVISIASVILAPVYHRFIHRFHLAE